MAQIEGLADGKRGNEQLGAMMFAIKHICGSVDDLLVQAEKGSSHTKSRDKAVARQDSSPNERQLSKSESTLSDASSSLGKSVSIMQATIAAEERNRILTEKILERLKGY